MTRGKRDRAGESRRNHTTMQLSAPRLAPAAAPESAAPEAVAAAATVPGRRPAAFFARQA